MNPHGLSPHPFDSPGPDSREVQVAREQLSIPAIVLIALAGLSIAFGLLSLLMNVAGGQSQFDQLRNIKGISPELIDMLKKSGGPLRMALSVLGIGLQGFVIFASLQMRQLKNWPIAVAGVFAGMLPFGSCCCCINIGVGIWAAVLLFDPKIKQQFT